MIVGKHLRYCPCIHGVILIDCWDYTEWPGPDKLKHITVDNFYINLAEQIKKFKNVCYIIDASTQLQCNVFSKYLQKELTAVAPVVQINDYSNFVDFCARNSSIKNWYVAGQSWRLCTHLNSIGLKSLTSAVKNNQLNFYANNKSFLKESGYPVEHNDFALDNLGWEYLNYFGYRLT